MALAIEGVGYVPPPQPSRNKARGVSAGTTALDAYDHGLLTQASKPAYDPQELLSAQQAVNDVYAMPQSLDQAENMVTQELYAKASQLPDSTLTPMPTAEQRYATATETLNAALRDQRTAALGVDPNRDQKPVAIKAKVDRMSREEYAALTPLQKSAVKFNTALVKAVRTDRRLQDMYDKRIGDDATTKETYDKALASVFPNADTADNEKTMYAPETLAVLRQAGYTDPSAELADFLNLDAGIRMKDVKRLEPLHGSHSGTTYQNPLTEDRMGLAMDLATGTANAQAALDKGSALLRKYGVDPLAAARESDVNLLGGAPNQEFKIPGYGTSEMDSYFQRAFDALGNSSIDTQGVFDAIRIDLPKAQRELFMKYAESRIVNALQTGDSLGNTEGVTYRNPTQVAVLLGLPGPRPKQPEPKGGANAHPDRTGAPPPAPPGHTPGY